jgi:hypothetical protein
MPCHAASRSAGGSVLSPALPAEVCPQPHYTHAGYFVVPVVEGYRRLAWVSVQGCIRHPEAAATPSVAPLVKKKRLHLGMVQNDMWTLCPEVPYRLSL